MEKLLVQYRKEKIKRNIALVFPNSYGLGMSSLGYQAVYHIIQSNPGIQCERAFVEPQMMKIKTLETSRELILFDAAFFSISFEADLVHIIHALQVSRIPVKRTERPGSKYPLIVVGGIAAAILPLYLREIADIVISGDAELALPPVLDLMLQYNDRDELMGKVQGNAGVFLASELSHKTLCYARAENPDLLRSVILADNTEFSGRGLIEVSKGCLFRCAFCLVSKAYGEYQAFPADKIIEAAGLYRGHTDKLGLIAATLTNHPDFKKIIRELNRNGFQLSFSAFRVEGLDDELLELIINNENKTLVIAPETGSLRLKKAVGKLIPNEVILSTVRRACRMGIKRLKLYFIIGLPGETMEDIQESVNLVSDVRKISQEGAKEFGYIPEIIVDINPLVPKPLTPFEDLPIEDLKITKKKIIFMKNRLRNFGRTFVYGESPKNALFQYQIANHLIDLEELIHSLK